MHTQELIIEQLTPSIKDGNFSFPEDIRFKFCFPWLNYYNTDLARLTLLTTNLPVSDKLLLTVGVFKHPADSFMLFCCSIVGGNDIPRNITVDQKRQERRRMLAVNIYVNNIA